MAAAFSPLDPLAALTTSLSLPADSPSQASSFLTASQAFESAPQNIQAVIIPVLNQVMEGESGKKDTLLKRWLLEMVGYGMGRSELSMEGKVSSECHG